jgi:hypothetical protein
VQILLGTVGVFMLCMFAAEFVGEAAFILLHCRYAGTFIISMFLAMILPAEMFCDIAGVFMLCMFFHRD